MTFIPKYSTLYLERLIVNLEAYLQAHEAEAFEWANGGSGLLPTAVWRRSRWYNTQFPVTSIFAVSTTPAEAEDASRITEDHVLTVEVELDGNDPDFLTVVVLRRIRAYDALLRKIEFSELFAGYDVHQTGGEWLDIGRHSYGSFIHESDPSLYKQLGSFEVRVHFMELRTPGT
jgi:hypothetical protein